MPKPPENQPVVLDDEEFFKEHKIEDEEEKELFRKRYLVSKYTKFREGKEAPPEQKKRKFLEMD